MLRSRVPGVGTQNDRTSLCPDPASVWKEIPRPPNSDDANSSDDGYCDRNKTKCCKSRSKTKSFYWEVGKTSDQRASEWNLTGTERGNTTDDKETQPKPRDTKTPTARLLQGPARHLARQGGMLEVWGTEDCVIGPVKRRRSLPLGARQESLGSNFLENED